MNFINLPDMKTQIKRKDIVTTLKQQIKEMVEKENKKIMDSIFGKDSFALRTDKPKCKHNCRYDYEYKFKHHCRYDYANNLIKRDKKPKEKELQRIRNMNKE